MLFKTEIILKKSLLLVALLLAGCTSGEGGEASPNDRADGKTGNPQQAGVITAGEWNDLTNWPFWNTIINHPDYSKMPAYWKYFTNNRIAVKVVGPDQSPVIDAPVKLIRDGVTLFEAKTDNKGNAELWVNLFQENPKPDLSNLRIDVNNGASITGNVKPYGGGINEIVVELRSVPDQVEIAFIVDATGSMGDELNFLKVELLDVITRVKNANPEAGLSMASVFYRDEGDEYVTRVSNFSTNINTTIDFIKAQNAGGGGDFPEAVHTAMDKAVNELQWSENAKTRLLFLLLDAPPHHNDAVIVNLQSSIAKAAEKGIKIIPITASGIDKETEFLMRFMAMTTNGTYVFITDHSGIGNSHLEPSVGQYEVEFLNNLMVRLINKYIE